MSRRRLVALLLLIIATPMAAQVTSLWYREAPLEGRIYVFNSPRAYAAFRDAHTIPSGIARADYGPHGEEVIFENETAYELYNLKHDKMPEPDETLTAPWPAQKPVPPTPAATSPTLTAGEAEVHFSLLLQPWFFADDTPDVANTFRMRRAEFRLYGQVTRDWAFEIMFDPTKTPNIQNGLPAGQPNCTTTDCRILQDLAILYRGFKGQEIGLGQKKIPLTEEGVRSASELDFADRAVITQTFSDRREAGAFYKGDFGSHTTVWGSVSNGTVTNTLRDPGSGFAYTGRVDMKPFSGLFFGASGESVSGETSMRLSHKRAGVHFRYDGTATLPLRVRAEYLNVIDGRLGTTDLHRNGWYISALYRFLPAWEAGARYQTFDRDRGADATLRIVTAGLHYVPKGKVLNMKADFYRLHDPLRVIAGTRRADFNQFIFAVQSFF